MFPGCHGSYFGGEMEKIDERGGLDQGLYRSFVPVFHKVLLHLNSPHALSP